MNEYATNQLLICNVLIHLTKHQRSKASLKLSFSSCFSSSASINNNLPGFLFRDSKILLIANNTCARQAFWKWKTGHAPAGEIRPDRRDDIWLWKVYSLVMKPSGFKFVVFILIKYLQTQGAKCIKSLTGEIVIQSSLVEDNPVCLSIKEKLKFHPCYISLLNIGQPYSLIIWNTGLLS